MEKVMYNNKKEEGYGVFKQQDILKYEGEWKNDKKNGLGKEYLKNNSYYEG